MIVYCADTLQDNYVGQQTPKPLRNIIHCISKSTNVRTCSNLHHFTFMYIKFHLHFLAQFVKKLGPSEESYGLLENG